MANRKSAFKATATSRKGEPCPVKDSILRAYLEYLPELISKGLDGNWLLYTGERDVDLTDKIVSLEWIQKNAPDTPHDRLFPITRETIKTPVAQDFYDWDYAQDPHSSVTWSPDRIQALLARPLPKKLRCSGNPQYAPEPPPDVLIY